MKPNTLKPTDDAGTAEKERLRRSSLERSRSSMASPTNVPPPKPISNSNAKEVSAATAVSVTSTSKIPASIKIKTKVAEKGKEKDHNENKKLEEEKETPKEKNEKNKKEKEGEEENENDEKSTTSDSSNSSSEDSSADDEEGKEEKDDEEEVENEEDNTGTQTTISTLTRNTTTTDTTTKPTIEEEDPISEFDGKENGNEEDPTELDLESRQKRKEIEEEDPITQFGHNADTPTKPQQRTTIIPISNQKDYSKGNGVRSNKGLKKFEYVDYNNSISTWTPLTPKEWSEWDLEHPPGENHKFWTKKAPIILHALEVWILNNVRINVPYMWHEEYNCHRNKPPKRPNHDSSSLLAVRMPTIYDLYNNVKKKVEGRYGTYSQYSSEKFASEIKYHPKIEELKQKMTKEDNVLTKAKKRFAVIHTSYKKLNVDSITTDYGIKLTRMFNDEKTKIENCIKKNEAFKKQFSHLQKRLSEHITEKVNLEKMDKSEFTEEEIESMKSAFTDAS